MLSYRDVKIRACPRVYAPAEDSFLLADAIDAKPGEAVLDMGTGTCILGIIAAKKAKRVVAVDVSDAAVRCAEGNAVLNDALNMVVRKSDLFSHVSDAFDLILFNPPYLPTETCEQRDEVSLAWDGGEGGREVIERFLEEVVGHVVPGGRLLMGGSTLSGYERSMEMLEERGFDVCLAASVKLGFEVLVVVRAVYGF